MYFGKEGAPQVFQCGVTIIPKTKRCGKNNCGDCPHGPYWYARAPHTATVGGQRLDLYIGALYSDTDLLQKVAPHLGPVTRAGLEREVRLMQARAELADVERSIAHYQQEAQALRRNFQRDMEQNADWLATAQRKRAALLAELNPPTKNPNPRKGPRHAPATSVRRR